MFLRVSLTSFLGVVHGMMPVTTSRVGMMGGLFVISALVVFGRFGMMARGIRVVLGGLFVVFSGFLGHGHFLRFWFALRQSSLLRKTNLRVREAFLHARLFAHHLDGEGGR
jgi:hypothetical protein